MATGLMGAVLGRDLDVALQRCRDAAAEGRPYSVALLGNCADVLPEILRRGGVIAYPTDTFYGIGCDIMNKKAIEKVYANGIRIAQGCGPDIGEAVEELNSMNLGEAMKDGLDDMSLVSAELVA